MHLSKRVSTTGPWLRCCSGPSQASTGVQSAFILRVSFEIAGVQSAGRTGFPWASFSGIKNSKTTEALPVSELQFTVKQPEGLGISIGGNVDVPAGVTDTS